MTEKDMEQLKFGAVAPENTSLDDVITARDIVRVAGMRDEQELYLAAARLVIGKMPSERRFGIYADQFAAFVTVARHCNLSCDNLFALRHLWDGFTDVVYIHGPATATTLAAIARDYRARALPQ